MDIIKTLSSHFERYLTVERVHPSATYNYKARDMFGLPIFETTMHKPKCTGGSWTYVAVPASARLDTLAKDDRLYIGSQAADRMFRGDGMRGTNFHHAQMRAGNGTDTPEAFLRKGQPFAIYRLDASRLAETIANHPELGVLKRLLANPTKHRGYWLEQLVLHLEPGTWRWNTSAAVKSVSRLVSQLH